MLIIDYIISMIIIHVKKKKDYNTDKKRLNWKTFKKRILIKG